jgi:diacylglycerol kinase (ATP)
MVCGKGRVSLHEVGGPAKSVTCGPRRFHGRSALAIAVRDTAIILNPRARSERADALVEELHQLAPEAEIFLTTMAGDARRLAAEAVTEGFRNVVAAGGDGTVNEVVNGLAGSSVNLGVLPVGTMNVFAKEHGLPAGLAAAWAIIQEGRIREIDLAAANGAHFIQLAGIGLDAQIVKETPWESKKTLGPMSYLLSAAAIAVRTPPTIVVEAADGVHEGCFVLVGNGRYYGMKLVLFPEARPDDGLLDILIFKNLGYLDIARYLGGVLLGKHTALSDVSYFQSPAVQIHSAEAVPIEVDGELSGMLPVNVRVTGKLRIFVP